MDAFRWLSFAFALGFITLQMLIIKYLMDLEQLGCECSMDWRRNYIIYFLFVAVVFGGSTVFLDVKFPPIVQTAMFVMAVLNAIYAIQYIYRLKKEKCECSESVYREILYVIAILNAIMYFFMLLFIIYYMYVIVSYYNTYKGMPRKAMNVKRITPTPKLKNRK